MHLKKILSLSLLFISISSQAKEILWLKLSPVFYYKDISIACSNSTNLPVIVPRDLFLAAEIDNSQVTRAILRDSDQKEIAKSIELTPSELVDIQLFEDKEKRNWLKTFPLSGRLLNWVFFRTAYLEQCQPSAPLKTLGPQPFTFTFNLSEIGSGPASSDSQKGEFAGNLVNGNAFQATLLFTQRQFVPRQP